MISRVAALAAQTYGLRLLREPRVQLLATGVVIGVLLAWRLVQFAAFTGSGMWGYDFSFYWFAGQRLLDGGALYAPEQLSGPFPPQPYYYLYPPFLAVLVSPLAAVFDDYRQAAWAWAALGALVGGGAVAAVARAEGFVERRRLLLLLAALVVFPPVVLELAIGNVHLFLLGLLGVAWLGVRRGDARGEAMAGVAVGIAALIKIFPGFVVVWFLLTGRLRAAVASVAAVGVLALVTLPLTGLEPWLQYPRVLLNLAPPVQTLDTLAPSLWLAELTGFTVARAVVTAAGLAVLAWSARSQPAALSFGVAVMVALLVAPAMYHSYLTLAVLPFLLALSHVGLVPWVALAYLAMFGGSQPGLGEWEWVVFRALPTLGALLLLGGLLRGRRQAAVLAAPPRRATTTAASS